MSKPEPLTPEYCDLRGYEFMPLFGHKLFASEFYTEASADEFRAGLRLWWAAWNQVPAGSLPNSDRALATLADFGRDIEAWQSVKERALHGFIECSDGRLYHPMICAEAIESYEERLRKSKRRNDDKERLKQWREMRRNQERNASHAYDTDDSETEVKRVSGAYQTHIRNGNVQRAARRDRDRDRDRDSYTDSSLRSESGDDNSLAQKPEVRVVGFTDPAPTRGSRLPVDWKPDEELISFARENGCDPDLVSAKFRDYWLGAPGQKGVKLDWRATFRNWCRTEAERGIPKQYAPTRQEKFRDTWKDVPDLEAFTR